MVLMLTSLLGQMVPASGDLVKRDYYYLNDQHLTARFGNTMVCGDHMCAPGEWTKMQENLNKAQIGHIAQNVTNSTTTTTMKTNSTAATMKTNSTTSTTSTPPVQPIPVPIPTPSPVPYSICNSVKAVLTNSTISSSVVAKVMTDLGCI
jgi:carbohydrate-binding DOMON domain-containing protein